MAEDKTMILCDTDILIEFYRGNAPKLFEHLHDIGVDDLAISAVTKGELYFGARNKAELRAEIRHHLDLLDNISHHAADLRSVRGTDCGTPSATR